MYALTLMRADRPSFLSWNLSEDHKKQPHVPAFGNFSASAFPEALRVGMQFPQRKEVLLSEEWRCASLLDRLRNSFQNPLVSAAV